MNKPSFQSSGQSTETAYRVEARVKDFIPEAPVELWDGILTDKWREVKFATSQNPAGIPYKGHGYKDRHCLLTYEAAVALAWTIIAQQGRHGTECRLIQYKLETHHSLEKIGIVEGLKIECNLLHRPTVKTYETV